MPNGQAFLRYAQKWHEPASGCFFRKKAAFQFPLAEKMCKLCRFCHKTRKKRLVIPPALAYDKKIG